MKWPWVEHQSSAWPSLGDAGDAGVRLDVALVHRLGVNVALDDDVGLGEAGREVACANSMRLATLDGLRRRRLDAAR